MASGGSLSFLYKMSEEAFDFICTACDKNNRTLEAVRYCVECLGYCCQECTDLHSRFPALKNHKLLGVGQGNQAGTQQPKLPEFPTERCIIHQGEVLDMYCEHHDVVGCSTCISKDHRACPVNQIHSIPDMIGSLFNKSRSKEVQEDLKELMVSLTTQGGSKDDQLATLKDSRDKALEKVTDFQHALETVVKTLAEMSRNEVEEMYNNIEKEILQEKTDLMKINDVLQETLNKLDKSDGNRAQQFACTKIAEKTIKETNMAGKKSNCNTDVKLSFTPNQSLMDCINGLKGIGEVSGPSRIKTDLYKVKESKEVRIKMSGDPYSCDAEGCCLILDNHFLVTDYYNMKLKLIDLQTLAVVDACCLSSKPRQICTVNGNEAVVTTDFKIQFVLIDGNKMKLTRQIKMPHDCFGISTKDEKLYVTDNGSSLYIYNMNGSLLETISQDTAGNELFSNSRHITFTENGNKMFVSDWQKGIAYFDELNIYQSTFNDSDLSGVCSAASDGRGNIFAVGYNSHNVVQFNEAGEKIGVVIKQQDGLQYPQSVCFDEKLSRLFVTMYSSNEVKIYELE